MRDIWVILGGKSLLHRHEDDCLGALPEESGLLIEPGFDLWGEVDGQVYDCLHLQS